MGVEGGERMRWSCPLALSLIVEEEEGGAWDVAEDAAAAAAEAATDPTAGVEPRGPR